MEDNPYVWKVPIVIHERIEKVNVLLLTIFEVYIAF